MLEDIPPSNRSHWQPYVINQQQQKKKFGKREERSSNSGANNTHYVAIPTFRIFHSVCECVCVNQRIFFYAAETKWNTRTNRINRSIMYHHSIALQDIQRCSYYTDTFTQTHKDARHIRCISHTSCTYSWDTGHHSIIQQSQQCLYIHKNIIQPKRCGGW